MSIPISDLINVNIAISPNAVATDGYGPLVFMTKEFKPVAGEAGIRIYTSKTEVDADFPDGEVQAAATAWYSQKPTPKTFLVGAVSASLGGSASSGTLIAGAPVLLQACQLITNGDLTLKIDGVTQSITGIDLSSEPDLDSVAEAIEGALTGVTVAQNNGVFMFMSSTVGPNSSVGFAEVSYMATSMNLTTYTGATSVAGTEAADITNDLSVFNQAAMTARQDYYYVAIERSLRDTTQQLITASWCESVGKVFGLATSDKDCLTIGNTSNSMYLAKQRNLRNTTNVYDASELGNEYPEISILGRASTVNFNVRNSALILAFKQGPVITTANLSPTELKALSSYNGNAFIDVAGNVLFYDGKMANGTWFDAVQGTSWLTQKVQLNVFNLFYGAATKVPWDETGVNMVNQQVINALELAVSNGLIGPGYDNEGNFYPDGYKVYSTDLSLVQSQKGARIWEGTSFIAIGTGALQGAVISGSFIQ